MADTTVTSPAPRKRRRWLRVVCWIFIVLILLLVAAYFVGTSSGFLKSVVLPRVSKSINADVTMSDASISPFKEVVFHNLKVVPHGQEQLLSAPEVRARYNLMDIIRGNIHVDEVAVVNPTVTRVENPDGSSNLDPITKGQKEKPAEEKKVEKKPSKPSKPPQIDLKKIALTDATIRNVKKYKDGKQDVAEISHVNVTLDDLKNGQTGKLTLGADIKVENNGGPQDKQGSLAAKLNGDFSFALSPDLKPGSVKGNTKFEITQAQGAFADLSTLGADLNCEATPTEIKEVALRFQKGSANLGQVLVSGPFDMEKTEGKLTVQILGLDKQVMNLAGASSGIDFGTTTLNCTNQIEITKGGSQVTATGQFAGNKIQITRASQTTPTLDFLARYDVTVYLAAKTALLRELTLTGMQKGNQLLHAELTSPMSLAWGSEANSVGDSTLNVTMNGLDLADWKPFLGTNPPTGNVSMKLKLLSQGGGKQLTFELNTEAKDIAAAAGTNKISQIAATVQVNGSAADMTQFKLANYKLDLLHKNEQVLSVSGSGTYDKASEAADMQATVQGTLARLLEIVPQPDANLSGGTIEMKVRVKQQQKTQSVTGTLALNDLTGKFGKNEFRRFVAEMDLDIAKNPQQIDLRRIQGKIAEDGKDGGHFDVSGTLNTEKNSGQITARLTDFNQNGVRAFLEPALDDKKLVSVAINANLTAQYGAEGEAALKGDLAVNNLVVNDPQNKLPANPLEAKLACDTSVHKKVADIRQFKITLTPTQRGTNEITLSGKVDMSNTNATQGNLKLAADSIDVTSYYDLFAKNEKEQPAEKIPAGKKTSAKTPAPSETPSSASSGPETEPEAKQLPLRNFAADVSIGKFYLREIEITNFHTVAKIDGGHVVMNPFQLVLNGAPVTANADVDLGVPGYKYDVSFNAKAIPMAPLMDSFQPDRKGQLHGTVTAVSKISGTGTTGANLKKNLTGQFDVNSTNLNLSVIDIKSRLMRSLINVVAMIPELLHNPAAGVKTLLGNVTGLGQGGLSEELKKSPIDAIIAKGAVGSGKLDLQQAVVQSVAFRADAKGTVMLNDILTNSTINIPVSISLGPGVAQKIGMSTNSSANGYVKLPDFYTAKGTIGDPKSDINELALGGLALKGITSIVPSVGGKAGNLIQGIGGLLPGQSSKTNAEGTNQPSSGQSPVNNLLDIFKKPKK